MLFYDIESLAHKRSCTRYLDQRNPEHHVALVMVSGLRVVTYYYTLSVNLRPVTI